MYRLARLIGCVSVAAVLFFSTVAEAHFVDRSWVFVSEKNLMTVSYDTDQFTANVPANFTFSLRDSASGAPMKFLYVRARILGPGLSPVFSTNVFHSDVEASNLSYTFAGMGVYTMEVAYRDAHGLDMATTSFPMSVAPAPGALDYVEFGAPTIILGLGFLYWSRRWWLPHRRRA